MLLPGCDRCGQCGCVCGTLPYTVTASFSGLKNRTQSQYCGLLFTSSFGSGATAVITSPGGCDDDEPDCGASSRGPVGGVLLTSPGGCYARPGRREPVLTLKGSGSAAVFTPTLVAVDDTLDAQCRSYALSSVAVSGAGVGYSYGESLDIAADGVTVSPASATLKTQRAAPTLTASVSVGAGAVLSIQTQAVEGSNPQTWRISSVSVTNGGDNYTNQSAIEFTLGANDQQTAAAVATVAAGTQPNDEDVVATVQPPSTGTGATWAYTWTPAEGGYKLDVAVVDGGEGYAVGDIFFFEIDGNGNGYEVSSVDENGSITGVTLYGDYTFPSGPGPITSITIQSGGQYWKDTRIPQSVEVDAPSGEYYTEDPTAPICAATVTVNAGECGGSGAEFDVTIGSDPSDQETFGMITGLSVANGGDGYLAWHWLCSNLASMNGVDFVLTAVDPRRFVTLGVSACYGSGACIHVVPVGDEIECESEPTTRTAAYDGSPVPIRQVSVVNGGSGYARYGREQPQWTVSLYGYTFTPTFGVQTTDECGLPVWPVQSVAITTGNSTSPTPLDGWLLQPSVSPPERMHRQMSAVVHTRQQPAVTATARSPGSGASFTVTLEQSQNHPRRWSVVGVSGGGGSGYSDGVMLDFTVPPRSGQYGDYTISSASAYGFVDEEGAIVSVNVTSGGAYYADYGVPQSVEVREGGKFYRENPSLPPHVADVTVTVDQIPPSSGSGASVSVVVEDDTGDPNFGKIVSASVVSQGSLYTLLGGPTSCRYTTEPCNEGYQPRIDLLLRGQGQPAELVLTDIRAIPGAKIVLRSSDTLADCDNLPGSFTLFHGAESGVSATVAAYGLVETPCDLPAWCPGCECPADGISGGTQIDFTSDIPCNGGTAAYNGNLANFDLPCSWTDPVNNITYESDATLTFDCCESKCSDTGECSYDVRAILSGGIAIPGQGGGQGAFTTKTYQGECETPTVDPVTGEVTGSLTIQADIYTIAIAIG